ncbi:hypothetical protein BKA93DRAFT_826137 [Sparassis latifolia]
MSRTHSPRSDIVPPGAPYLEVLVQAGRLRSPYTECWSQNLERYALVRLPDDVPDSRPRAPASSTISAPGPRVFARLPRRASRRTLSEGGLRVFAPALSREAVRGLHPKHKRTAATVQIPEKPWSAYTVSRGAPARSQNAQGTTLRLTAYPLPTGERIQYDERSTYESLKLALSRDPDSWPRPSSPAYSPPPSPRLPPASFARVRTRAGSTSDAGTPSLLDASQPSALSSPSLTLAYTPAASALVGLGISGLRKADGAPFDGLGLLPRRPGTPFADADQGSSSTQWWAYDEDARELDDILGSLSLSPRAHPAGSESSPPRLLDEALPAWMPSPPRRFGMPRAPSRDDVFLSRPNARSTPGRGGRVTRASAGGGEATPERRAWKP